MKLVLLTAIGVGMATVFGSVIGFLFRKLSHTFSDIILSFAAGIMLAAAVIGLVLPSLDYGGKYGIIITVLGIFCGAVSLNFFDKFVPHLHRLVGVEDENHDNSNLSKVLLFVFAIGIHNLPEGIAAGVGFGSGDTASALFIAGGIALQNLPEGMVIISPMLLAGVPPRRAFFIAALTGAVEVLGTFIGYFAVSIASAVLPFALAFAGGTMLFVICDDMIFENNTEGSRRSAVYALLAGFSLMLLF